MTLIRHNNVYGLVLVAAALIYYSSYISQTIGVMGWIFVLSSSSSFAISKSSPTSLSLSSSSPPSPTTTAVVSNQEEKQNKVNSNENDDGVLSDFQILAGNVGNCLIQSDLKRDSGFDGSSTGWTSWVDEASAFRLQKCIDKLQLVSSLDTSTIVTTTTSSSSSSSSGSGRTETLQRSQTQQQQQDNDDILRWLRWLKSCPSSMVIELTDNLRHAVNETLSMVDIQKIVNQNYHEFLSRIAFRLFILPSGSSLANNLRTEPGAMVYGKLLYGGVTRYRIIGTQGTRSRKAGERTAIHNNNKAIDQSSCSWLQYGGTERNYDSIDMGPCAFIELTILPKGSELSLAYTGDTYGGSVSTGDNNNGNNVSPSSSSSSSSAGSNNNANKKQNLNVINEMTIVQSQQCNPELLFEFQQDTKDNNKESSSKNRAIAAVETAELYNETALLNELDDAQYIEGIETTFTSVLGGLQNEVDTIIRRVLDGRALQLTPTSRYESSDDDSTSDEHDDALTKAMRAREMQEMLDLGLHPVRGLLLYGHPGCGKTALAREISRLLTDREPKIVSAPELLDRWVGGSEKLVRDLFVDAETELRVCGNDPTKSALHVIVIDEIDAVFRKRSSASDSGEVVRASAVNQILAKLDGVNALGNVLVIGTTNRRELLDPALLRPGRLEVQLEVPLPDREGRREILQIHFGPLRARGRLSRPLCQAIDGVSSSSRTNPNFDESDDDTSVTSSFLSKIFATTERVGRRRRLRDLAADRWTKGFSGADIAGLVRCAGSLALSRARRDGSGVDGLLITVEDVLVALKEVKQ